jgi:PTS system N-acetylgalactosamine-specific IIA component
VSAVEQIAGCGGVFLAVSNRDLSGQDIESSLRALAEDTKVRVFFTDLPGGSATLAVRRMMREDPGILLITGANLATLLEFAFLSKDDLTAAARVAAEKGRASLGAYGGT